jgi:hypothetical protein
MAVEGWGHGQAKHWEKFHVSGVVFDTIAHAAGAIYITVIVRVVPLDCPEPACQLHYKVNDPTFLFFSSFVR